MCLYLLTPMPVTIRTEITIHASPESVSAILFDFADYHQWNSWIQVAGPPSSDKSTYYLSLVGSELTIKEGEELQYSPIIKMASPSVLTWTWHDKHKHYMAHEHYFEIIRAQKNSSQCVVKHGQRFSGALARAKCYTKYYQKKQAAFEAFNKELKIRAEGLVSHEQVSKK